MEKELKKIKEALLCKIITNMGRDCDMVWIVYYDTAEEKEIVLHIQCP